MPNVMIGNHRYTFRTIQGSPCYLIDVSARDTASLTGWTIVDTFTIPKNWGLPDEIAAAHATYAATKEKASA